MAKHNADDKPYTIKLDSGETKKLIRSPYYNVKCNYDASEKYLREIYCVKLKHCLIYRAPLAGFRYIYGLWDELTCSATALGGLLALMYIQSHNIVDIDDIQLVVFSVWSCGCLFFFAFVTIGIMLGLSNVDHFFCVLVDENGIESTLEFGNDVDKGCYLNFHCHGEKPGRLQYLDIVATTWLFKNREYTPVKVEDDKKGEFKIHGISSTTTNSNESKSCFIREYKPLYWATYDSDQADESDLYGPPTYEDLYEIIKRYSNLNYTVNEHCQKLGREVLAMFENKSSKKKYKRVVQHNMSARKDGRIFMKVTSHRDNVTLHAICRIILVLSQAVFILITYPRYWSYWGSFFIGAFFSIWRMILYYMKSCSKHLRNINRKIQFVPASPDHSYDDSMLSGFTFGELVRREIRFQNWFGVYHGCYTINASRTHLNMEDLPYIYDEEGVSSWTYQQGQETYVFMGYAIQDPMIGRILYFASVVFFMESWNLYGSSPIWLPVILRVHYPDHAILIYSISLILLLKLAWLPSFSKPTTKKAEKPSQPDPSQNHGHNDIVLANLDSSDEEHFGGEGGDDVGAEIAVAGSDGEFSNCTPELMMQHHIMSSSLRSLSRRTPEDSLAGMRTTERGGTDLDIIDTTFPKRSPENASKL